MTTSFGTDTEDET